MTTGVLPSKRPPGEPAPRNNISRPKPLRTPIQKAPIVIEANVIRIANFRIMLNNPVDRRHLIVTDIQRRNVVTLVVPDCTRNRLIDRTTTLNRLIDRSIAIARWQFTRRMLQNKYFDIHSSMPRSHDLVDDIDVFTLHGHHLAILYQKPSWQRSQSKWMCEGSIAPIQLCAIRN